MSVMRTVLGACVVAGAAALLAAGCGGSSASSGNQATLVREANLYEIDQIEVKFHRATSTHNLNLMMSLFAPGAVFNVEQQTLTGKAQIRKWFAANPAFQPHTHWESDTPSYKLRATVNGDKGTLYFECHYIDTKTGKVVAHIGVDHNLQKIDGKWLIVDSAAAPAPLRP